jgi:hypothetical protein
MHPDLGDKDYGWLIADLTHSHYFDGDETLGDTEVIGNIYENPVLLKCGSLQKAVDQGKPMAKRA